MGNMLHSVKRRRDFSSAVSISKFQDKTSRKTRVRNLLFSSLLFCSKSLSLFFTKSVTRANPSRRSLKKSDVSDSLVICFQKTSDLLKTVGSFHPVLDSFSPLYA